MADYQGNLTGQQIDALPARITSLENKVFPLDVTLTPSVSLLEYDGTAKSLSVSWTTTVNGSAVSPTSLSLKVNNVEKCNDKTLSTFPISDMNTHGDNTLSLTVTYGGVTKTVSTTVKMLYKTIWGFGPSSISTLTPVSDTTYGDLVSCKTGVYDFFTEEEVTKKGYKAVVTKTLTSSVATTSRFLWVCVDSNFGDIESDSGDGVSLPLETSSTTIDSHYKCYKSLYGNLNPADSVGNTGKFTVKIKIKETE